MGLTVQQGLGGVCPGSDGGGAFSGVPPPVEAVSGRGLLLFKGRRPQGQWEGVGGWCYSRIDSRCSAGCAGSSLCLPACPGGPEPGGGAGSTGPFSPTSCPAPRPPSYSVHQLVPTQTHPRPVEMPAWVAGNAHPHPKAWNAETSTFSLADPSLSARQIGWRSIASPCRQGN